MPPFFAYIHKHSHHLQGSGYKYYQLLRSHYGGLIAGSLQALPATTSRKPDLAFVRGDLNDDYLQCKRDNVPYILIEHDCNAMRCGIELSEIEKDRMENAAGVIFPTTSVAHFYMNHKIILPPWLAVPLKPLKSDLAFHPLSRANGKNIVYTGNVTPWRQRSGPYGYKSLHKVFERFQKSGWTVHAYLNATKMTQESSVELDKQGVILHEWLPYPKLLQELSQFQAGLHAFNDIDVTPAAANYGYTALPNKCWDYLAASIPTIAFNVGVEAAATYDHKWGLVIKDSESFEPRILMKRVWTELPYLFTTNPFTSIFRFSNVIENHLADIEHLVNVVLREKREIRRRSSPGAPASP